MLNEQDATNTPIGTANAFVLPGGKVFVHSGILRVAQTEDGLAAVLGHEIAHNVAEHMGERLSGSIGTNILVGAITLLTGGVAGIATWTLGNYALDLLFGLPMGRLQESEADYIGLMMMAEACYDPREALSFWLRMQRMQQLEQPEWLSTHPSVSSRLVPLLTFCYCYCYCCCCYYHRSGHLYMYWHPMPQIAQLRDLSLFRALC